MEEYTQLQRTGKFMALSCTQIKEIAIDGERIICTARGQVIRVPKRKGTNAMTYGNEGSMGYLVLTIGKKQCRVHRLIAMAFLGDYSEDLQVDHINGDKHDNKLTNLRMATPLENNRAYRAPTKRETSSLFRGVSWNTKAGKWRAAVRGRKPRHVGSYDSENEAALAYNHAALIEGYDKSALNTITS